jgi:perosamine synthetase
MEKLEEFISRKRIIAANYHAHLADLAGIRLPAEAPWARSTYWLYTILISNSRTYGTSRKILHTLREWGIQCRPLWQPLHRSPAYSQLPPRVCPVADRLYSQALSLPSSVSLTCEQQNIVIRKLKTCVQQVLAAA